MTSTSAAVPDRFADAGADAEGAGPARTAIVPDPARPRPRRHWGAVGAYLVAGLALLAYLLPLLFVANASLKSQSGFLTGPDAVVRHPHFSNYVTAWDKAAFNSLVGNSVLYTLVSATAATFLSLFLAFPIARGYIRFSGWWYRLFVVSLFLPLAITTQFQLLLDLHLYDTRIGYLLLMTANFGVGPFLLTSYLRSLPKEMDEAAAIDGVGYFRYIFQIVLPLSKPAIVTVFIFQAITVWNDIINATIYLSSPSKQPLTRGLLNFSGQYSSQVPLLAAAILSVALPLLLVYVFAQRYFVAGALNGSFKG